MGNEAYEDEPDDGSRSSHGAPLLSSEANGFHVEKRGKWKCTVPPIRSLRRCQCVVFGNYTTCSLPWFVADNLLFSTTTLLVCSEQTSDEYVFMTDICIV